MNIILNLISLLFLYNYYYEFKFSQTKANIS